VMKTLGSVCRFLNGGTPSKAVPEYFEGDIPWITSADISGPVASKARSFITDEAVKNSAVNKVAAGAVLLVTRTGVGKVAVAANELCFSQDITALLPDESKLDASYLVHFLLTKKEHFLGLARGATIQGITRNVVSDLSIPLPPIPEQRRIAAILDQADALRAKRREALVQLDSLTQSIFIEMFGEISTNSKGWNTCTVGDVSDCIVPGRDKPKSFSGDIPWVTTSDLQHLELTLGSSKKIGLSDTEIDDVRARVIPSGSVIISCVGDLGIVSIAGAPMVVNQQLHSFQCHSNLNNIFLMYSLALQKPFMLAKASSTTLPYMNKTVCNSIPIVMPPLILQKTFAARIQAIESLKFSYRVALSELDSLFSSLQYRAFQSEL
jgi:type I restriction enzyme S subunit